MAPVLKDVNLKIEPGTFVGIVGQSGSGKHADETFAEALRTRIRSNIDRRL